ncbi:MAG: P-loop NTPase fold protein [Cyanobacteria bacterium J06627_8]
MTTSEHSLATTLKEAYRACDVLPLSEKTLAQYYIPFKSRQYAISDINGRLMISDPEESLAGRSMPLLFTGHIGCGKSSELAHLAQIQKREFLVVDVQAEQEIDALDVEYTDLYLLIIKRVEYELRKHQLRFDHQLLTSFEEWFAEITNETEQTIVRSVNVDAEASLGAEAPFLAKLLVKVMAQIKGSTTEKQKIRQLLIPQVSRLITDINALLTDGHRKIRQAFPEKKGLLIILDGLDKCPPNVAQRLFFDYAAQLLVLHPATIIYTVPIAALYTQRGISPAFEIQHTIPMIDVYRKVPDKIELDYDQEGLHAIASMVEKRVDSRAIFETQDQLLNIAKASGGHVRHMMQMVRTACIQAIGMGHFKLQAEHVAYAAKQLQFQFERATPRTHYPELARIAMQKEITDDEIGRELLFSTAVLEYNGDSRWVYPHPVVRQSELFKRALADLQS